MAATSTARKPLVEELMRTEGKAEIVNGEIKKLPITGDFPATRVEKFSLRSFFTPNALAKAAPFRTAPDFCANCPIAALFRPTPLFTPAKAEKWDFFPQPPIFAVEVRSENDYGRRAEREIAQKRADYFAAGTLVVWDVDLRDEEVIAKYSAQNPQNPEIFRRGEIGERRTRSRRLDNRG